MTIFNILKDIIYDKHGDLASDPDFKKSWSSFMVCRYLSMSDEYCKYAEIANRLQTVLQSEELYFLLLQIVPKNRNYYIKYISKSKQPKD